MIFIDKINFLRFIFFSYIFIFAIILIKNKKFISKFTAIDYKKINYKITFLFLIFFLISILPLSDADSVAVHLRSATFIFENGLSKINLNKNFEFLSLLNSEIILIFSPIIQSDNCGSQLNFFTVIMLYIITKKNLSFFEFLLSCPLFIFLISTQKLQLFFGLLFLVLFILVQKNKIKSRLELFLFVTLISFYASGKIYYILLSLILIVYFLIKNQNKIKDTFLFD